MFSAPAFSSLPPTAVGQLFDVVHHAVQVPLCVDLVAPTQIQTRKLFIVPEVAKYRLDGAGALAVKAPASGGVDSAFHALAGAEGTPGFGLELADLPAESALLVSQALAAQCARLAILRPGREVLVTQTVPSSVEACALERLARRSMS